MSQKIKVTQYQRRQIRRLIRESIREKQMLFEQRSLIVEDICWYNKEKDALGYSPRMIEEGIADLFGAGITSGIKQNIIEYLLSAMNFNKDSVPGRFVINMLENFNILGMNKYFGKDKCGSVAGLVSKASVETISELGAKRVIGLIYHQFSGKDLEETEFGQRIESGMGKLVTAAGREIVNEVIYDFIGPTIEKPIVEIFCNYESLTDFFKRGIFQGELKGQLKNLGATATAAAGLGAADVALDAAESELSKRDREKISGSGSDAAKAIFGKGKK